MPRTPRNKENKKVKIIEEVKEPEPAPEIEPEPEQHPSTDEELEIPKKRTKQRSEKQLYYITIIFLFFLNLII